MIYGTQVSQRPSDPRDAQRASERGRSESIGATVLVVDDNDFVRDLVEAALAPQGYTVLVASRSADALATAAAHPGPLHPLITDVTLGEISGPDLAARLAAARPGLHVLYISGHPNAGPMEPTPGAGHTAFLQKPFALSVLAAKVRELLASEPL